MEPSFYRIQIQPTNQSTTGAITTKYQTDTGALTLQFQETAYQTLVQLKELVLHGDRTQVEIFTVTEEDLKNYILMKQLERYEVALAVNSRTVNYFDTVLSSQYPYLTIRLVKQEGTTYRHTVDLKNPLFPQVLKTIHKFNPLDLWVFNSLPMANTQKLYRVHTGISSDRLFSLAQEYMPYVVDELLTGEEARYPILLGMSSGQVQFIRQADLFEF